MGHGDDPEAASGRKGRGPMSAKSVSKEERERRKSPETKIRGGGIGRRIEGGGRREEKIFSGIRRLKRDCERRG